MYNKEVRKIKCVNAVIMLFVVLQMFVVQSFATAGVEVANEHSTIYTFVSNIGRNWDVVKDQFCNNLQNEYDVFLKDQDNIQKHRGLLDIKSATVTEIVDVNYLDIADSFSYDYDLSNTRFCVVGIDFDVYEENSFYCNGLLYNAISLVKEDNVWKIVEFVQIENPKKLIEKKYNLDDNFSQTINIREARNCGDLLNGNNEKYGDLFTEYSVKNNGTFFATNSTVVKNKRTIPTDNTMVSLGKYNDVGSFVGQVSVPFHQYCVAVTAGEVRGSEFDGGARKACIVAIKTFTWHYLIIPKLPSMSIHITTKMQAYRPDKVNENPKVTSDYNVIKDLWMESSEGYIFEASYKAGTYGLVGRNNGDLKQNGVRYLVEECGYRWQNTLDYFYSYSDKSAGQITLFDKYKNVILYK